MPISAAARASARTASRSASPASSRAIAGAVEPGLVGGGAEHALVADVLAELEVAAEEHHRRPGLQALGRRPADQPVGVEGVRRPVDTVEAELDAGVAAERLQAGVGHRDPVAVAELRLQVRPAVEPLGRDRRVELEGMPADARRDAAPRASPRAFIRFAAPR